MRLKLFIGIFFSILLWQCARQGQPSGGPKDIKPPVLLSSIPSQGQRNFKGKNISLNFDEFIKLNNEKEEIIITPSPGQNTKFLVKKKSLIIIPEKNWIENTTYSIVFRNAVQDLNEGNSASDLRLSFSTGPTIDSLSIKGFVSEMFKEKVTEKITVALYQEDTFDIFKHRPIYFTKTNKKGRFSINNLKAGDYYLYAFEDKNKNIKVDSKTESFGFVVKSISIPDVKDSINFSLVRVDTRPLKLTSVKNTSTISIIRFNKSLDSVNLFSLDKKNITGTFGDNRSELFIYKNFATTDSTEINLWAIDSLQQRIDTSFYVKFSDGKIPTSKFRKTDWNININPKEYQLEASSTFNKIIKKVNLDSIYFQLDTSNYQTVNKNEIRFDTLTKKMTLSTKLKINAKQKKLSPVLLLGKSAFISIDKDSTKSQDIKIPIPTIEGTGTVSIEVKTEAKHYEIQMSSVDDKTVLKFRDLKKYTFLYVKPTEYRIRIIVDDNNNRRWDPGNFYKKENPERVILYKTIENKYTFPVRANWEIGPLLISF